MYQVAKLEKNLWRICFKIFGCCVYLWKSNGKTILFDTSSIANKLPLKKALEKIELSPEDIDVVILTHKHFDHDGNLNLFKNSKLYGPKEDFSSDKIKDIKKLDIKGMKKILTPGHTKGSVCYLLVKEKALISGDTLFHNGYIGRTDLLTSQPEKMRSSLNKLSKLHYKHLCPGHLY